MSTKYLIFVFLVGAAWAQTDPTDINLDNLPPELEGKINKEQITEARTKATAALKDKCLKNGGENAYSFVEKEYTTLPDCVKTSLNISDPNALMEEVEKAKPTGTVDEVFKKYCAKTPKVEACLKGALDALKPCLEDEEKKSLKVIYNITQQLADFICFKEGDRIALFIAEGGPECYQEKAEDIQACINSTFSEDFKDFNTSDISANNIPKITFDDNKCKQLVVLEKCVIRALESCSSPTSANIVESLFKFARKATPCKPPAEEKSAASPNARKQNVHIVENQPGSAIGLSVTSAAILMGVVANLAM